MTATAYKSSILHLLEDIEDEQVLGDAYLAIQSILHPDEFEEEGLDEQEIVKRLEQAKQGNVSSHSDMAKWINNLTQS
jgi:hypothetical protein